MAKKKMYLRMEQELLEALTRRAEDAGMSRASFVERELKELMDSSRVLCPECDGVFRVDARAEKITCPYCGAREGETIDDFIFN